MIRENNRYDDDQRSGGNNATRPATVEGEDRRTIRRFAFAKKESCNDEAGDDKKDVDADESPAELSKSGMEQNDEKYGNGP